MKNTTNPEPNYVTNNITLQMFLPLYLEYLLDKDDMVFSFLKALEGVNLRQYLKNTESRGRKGYDRVMLLRVMLFAYMMNVRSYHSIAKLCINDIRFIYLTNEERPSAMALSRLNTSYLVNSIDWIYRDITKNIADIMTIDTSKQYIDGTKIEADANKYSFVYRKRIVNARARLYERITESIRDINKEFGYSYSYDYSYEAMDMIYIVQYLMEVMLENDIEFVYGKGKRKSDIQRYYDTFIQYYSKLNEYEYWLSVIGERNSCSKTDHDATMCATKMDYYCNTGLSRPCYNAQIGVSDGIIVNAELYQNPGDPKTFIPFMERYNKMYGTYPKYPMADAAYGTMDNYMYCIEKKMEPVMKYTMYAKKKDPKYKKDLFRGKINWERDEQGNYVCPGNHIFDQYIKDKYNDQGQYLKIEQLYKSKESCAGCQFKDQCLKGKSEEKIISRNRILEEIHGYVDEYLGTEEGKELKKQRSIQAEGAFGVIKQDMGFTRFNRTGMKNTRTEFLLVCLAYNLRKYHQYLMKNKENKVN